MYVDPEYSFPPYFETQYCLPSVIPKTNFVLPVRISNAYLLHVSIHV